MSSPALKWTQSSFCADFHCVEVAIVDGSVFVRDGKNVDLPYLRFSRSAWSDFCEAVTADELTFA